LKAFTVLSNDLAGRKELFAEHGLSLFIRNGEDDYLFDTGGSFLFLENAGFMNLQIENIKLAVLSHSHSDHIGGIAYLSKLFSMITRTCDVVSPNLDEEIKLPGLRISTVKKSRSIDSECHLILSSSVYKNKTINEISLIIDRTLFVGCGHAGIENIVAESSKFSPVTTIAGGFHNFEQSGKEMKETAEKLYASGIRKIILLHCSSMNSIRYFEDAKICCEVGKVGNCFNYE
jgi:7,8-dihydropterin-6-yl-methyl-4-(beta-D-ribofuranosyl)aminobenzene 5'-phosphate synthase